MSTVRSISLDEPGLDLPDDAAVDVIVDRLVRGKDPAQRRADSIETAFEKGMGRCRVSAVDQVVTYIRGWRCAHCGTDHIEPQPNLFRYNSPLGACPVCEGLGRTIELDLDRIVPDRSRTIRQGALAPWSTPVYQGHLQGLLENADELGIPVNVPFEQLTGDQVERLLDGVPDKGFSGLKGFFGDLERRSFQVEGARLSGPVASRSALPRLSWGPVTAGGPGGQDRGARHCRAVGP